jgi:hypothetical protein
MCIGPPFPLLERTRLGLAAGGGLKRRHHTCTTLALSDGPGVSCASCRPRSASLDLGLLLSLSRVHPTTPLPLSPATLALVMGLVLYHLVAVQVMLVQRAAVFQGALLVARQTPVVLHMTRAVVTSGLWVQHAMPLWMWAWAWPALGALYLLHRPAAGDATRSRLFSPLSIM